MYSLPNVFTLLNLVCGCVALFGVFYETSAVVIVSFGLALLFDFLDGIAARILNQSSELGKELDSLADLVSFGVVPTFLFVDIVERSTDITSMPLYGLIFIVAASAALRLARFNLDIVRSPDFSGLPSPAMAIIAFGFWINLDNSMYPSLEVLGDPNFVLILAIALALFMNLPLRFIKFAPGLDFTLNQILSLLLILVFLAGLFINWRISVLITALTYFVLSLLLPLFSRSQPSGLTKS